MNRTILIVFLALGALSPWAAACNGNGGQEDAADVMDLDGEGEGEGDTAVDPDLTEDLTTETDDGASDEAAGDEMPAGAGTCDDPVLIGCGAVLSSETTEGAGAALTNYTCGGYGITETGPERVYRIDVDAPAWATVTMTPAGAWDLDLFVLDGSCAQDACSLLSGGAAAETLSFRAEADTASYVVVDGYNGAAGGYSITIECGEAEDCGNSADDNGNGLVDCEDSQCWQGAACAEVCDNAADEDLNGLIDCEDAQACAAAPNCFEYACGDGSDDDGDTVQDCEDFDCIGSADCAGGAGVIGDPCVTHDQCASGACLLETVMGWPGGYCSQWSFDISLCGFCPTGTVSMALGLSGPCYCVKRCTVPGDCRSGYTCQEFEPGVNGCIGGCTDSAQCTATGYCSGSTADPGDCTTPPELCAGGVDEDGDTLADCLDLDCLFTAACSMPAPLAGGATCAEAVVIEIPGSLPGTVTAGGTLSDADGDDHDPVCDQGYSTADVAYMFTLEAATRVTIDLLGEEGGLDAPVLSLTRACSEPDLRCSFGDAGGRRNARIDGLFTAGVYYLFVEADIELGAVGDYTLGLRLTSP